MERCRKGPCAERAWDERMRCELAARKALGAETGRQVTKSAKGACLFGFPKMNHAEVQMREQGRDRKIDGRCDGARGGPLPHVQ